MVTGREEILRIVNEELSKPEVKTMVDSALSSFVKDREFKREVRNLAVEVLDDFFREMWRKNGFWKNPIKNK